MDQKLPNFCDYGCGNLGVYKFKNGKICCSKNFQSCPEHIINKKQKVKEGTINYYKNETPLQKEKRIKAHKKFWKEEKKKEWRKKTKIYNQKNKRTIEKLKQKFPTFCKVEELRYNPDFKQKEIQVHCKNHKCPNSKQNNGWFTPTPRQLEWRIASIEHGTGGRNFYCSINCKKTCPLYGFNPNHAFLINQKTQPIYTQEEYDIFRKVVLERENYFCEYCGRPAKYVHHERPQKLEPYFSLDPDYAIAVCKKCHYEKGHPAGTECSTGRLAHKVCKEK